MSVGRVLIVEDFVALEGRPLEQMLQANGIEVVGIAGSIEEAVEQAVASHPDVVLMDIWIPPKVGEKDDKEGGIKAAKEIQRRCNVGMIFVTGHNASTELMEQIERVCPNAMFITKPWNPEQTLATVRLALVRKQGCKLIFVCYAHEDRAMKAELVKFLDLLPGVGIDVWDDTRIRMGDRWRVEVMRAVHSADAAIMLVSVDFMRSKFIQELELPMLLAGEQQRRMRVIPVFVGAVPAFTLQHSRLSAFAGLNSPDEPLNRWTATRRELQAWRPLCESLAQTTSWPEVT
jgi:DNA-binding NarL/FixJ family response regulator